MASFFHKAKPVHKYNFHDDEALHDQTPEAWAWNANLLGDAVAAAKLAKTALTSGFQSGAKATVAELDINDPLSKAISKEFVSKLWGSMLHPPLSYRGNQYQYRMPDGSYNNIMYPDLGKSGLPYAKTVQGKRPRHGAKPDPGDLFDLLMARQDDGIESASGINSMLLCHATLIIHDIFRTDDDDPNLSATSSYLDLAPLYGSDRPSQLSVRAMTDGLLKPDTFVESRLVNQPPGVCIYLIMYNRFHNYVAKQLLEINENGRFSLPPGFDKDTPAGVEALKKRDEDLFQTARLVTCGMYINIAIHDYLRCLMLMHGKDTPWTLDPRVSLPEKNNKKGLQRGEGNMVSVEFNLLYRFHSPISRREAEWSEEAMINMMKMAKLVDDNATDEQLNKGEKYTTEMAKNGEVSVPQFRALLETLRMGPKLPGEENATTPEEKAKFDKMRKEKVLKDKTAAPFWPQGLDQFIGARGRDFRFKRGADGKFDDAQLAGELMRVMEDPINQFGAQNIPKVFKAIEILGMLQARNWEVATLNEFREFFGMSRHTNFEDMNDDVEIQNKLRDLYEDPDLVELYPGLFCEGRGRNLDPGTDCPAGESTALWRAVFSDAVTLVRSDRFYTIDWNVDSLTAWGMREVTSDPKINKGSVMHRLFQRALPGFFTYNSLHMWQPFYTPTKNAVLAQEQGYINFLDLRGLEDQNGKPWEVVNGKVKSNFFKDLCEPKGNKVVGRKVRRQLKTVNNQKPVWRGEEFATPAPKPVKVENYDTIKNVILGGKDSFAWINPSILEVGDIPDDALRRIMTAQWPGWKDALPIVDGCLKGDSEKIFMEYFLSLSQNVRIREQRSFQKTKDRKTQQYVQALQIDMVKDYVIPIVTRFIADFLGFWEEVKTVNFPNRKYNENQIYQHIDNCHDFESYDSDPTKTWQRRMAYKDSIKILRDLTAAGVTHSERGRLEGSFLESFAPRVYGYEGDSEQVKSLRKLAVEIVQALRAKFRHDEVVAIMLATALDACQKVVVTFTEIVAYFLDPRHPSQHDITGDKDDVRTKHWSEIQKLAWQGTKLSATGNVVPAANPTADAAIERYVLEASRFSHKLSLARTYSPADAKNKTIEILARSGDSKIKISAGDTVVLNIHEAYEDLKDSTTFPNASRFDASGVHSKNSYLVFGASTDASGKSQGPRFSKRVTLIALTGMIKHAAQLKQLRVAHDKPGRLKRVETPDQVVKYTSVQWDRLQSYPATWNLRFDGVGLGVFAGGDNADQGHGQNQVWHTEKTVTEQKIVTDDSGASSPVAGGETVRRGPVVEIGSVTKSSMQTIVGVRELRL